MERRVDTAGIQSRRLDERQVVLLRKRHGMLCWHRPDMPVPQHQGDTSAHRCLTDGSSGTSHTQVVGDTHLRSLLFPTSITTIAWSACSLNSLSQRSTLSKVTLCHAMQVAQVRTTPIPPEPLACMKTFSSSPHLGDVVHQERAHCPPIVRRCDGTVALLAGWTRPGAQSQREHVRTAKT